MQTELTGVPTTCKATTGHGAAPSAHSGYRPPKARKLTSALTLYLGVGGQDCDTDIPQGEHGWTEVTGQVCDKLVRVTGHRPQPFAGGRIFPHVPSSPCEETAAGPWVALTIIRALPRSAKTDGLKADRRPPPREELRVHRAGSSPPQAVCERGGPRRVAFPVHHAALTAGAQRPERRGGAGQIEADVPEGVYRGGDATVSERR